MITFAEAVGLRRRLFDMDIPTAHMIRFIISDYIQENNLDALHAQLAMAFIENQEEFNEVLEKDAGFKLLWERVQEYAD